MAGVVWLLAMACAQVGVVLGDGPGVDSATRAALLAALEEAVEEGTGAPVGSSGGPHLWISALGAATRLRIQVQKVVPGIVDGETETLDLPRATPGHWRALLVPVVQRLFPKPALDPPKLTTPPGTGPPPTPTALTQAPPPSAEAKLWPWVGVGATGVLLAGGIVAGVLNRDLVARGEQSTDPAEVDRLNGQVFASGLTANLLLGSALIAAVVTTVGFVAGDEP